MSNYHIYGIGNALLDLDFEVSESTLARLQVDKGLMTLIDEKRHHLLLEELDGIKHLKACGGSAANSIFTAQQLGAKTFYSCKVGNDAAGDFFYQNLIESGVKTNLNERPREGITGKCIVMVTPDADRTMNTFLGTTSTFSRAHLSEYAVRNSQFLYIEGYLVASTFGCEAAIIAREMAEKHNIKVAMSLSDPNMTSYFKDGLREIIGTQIEIIFCNETEAMIFTNANSLEEAQEKLKQYAKTFIITLGDKGSLIFDGNVLVQIPAYKVDVLDTVGAGDVFAGTFLYAICHGFSYSQAGSIASFAAAKVVGKFGPRLNSEEIKEVMQRVELEKNRFVVRVKE